MMASPNKTHCAGKMRAIQLGRWPSNPRELRAIEALIAGPVMRRALDDIAGCVNAPDLVARLKRTLGIGIACERVRKRDRDGRRCEPGRYYLTPEQRDRALSLRREAQTAQKLRQATIPQGTPRKRAGGPLSKREGRK